MSLSPLFFTNTPANDAERVGDVAPVAELPTRHGLFRIHVFTERATGLDHVALVSGDVFGQERAATRIHSECLTAAGMLQRLDVRSVSLMTNNPDKIAQLDRAGMPVVARIPHVIGPGPLNHAYLETKEQRSGRLLYPNGVPEA